MKKAGILLFTFIATALSTLYGADTKELEEKINTLSQEVANIKTDMIIAEDKISFFDLTQETSIDKINTNAGPLYLQITNISSSKSGYNATVHIGNPLFATFNQITINFTWRSSNEWIKKSVSIPNQLLPSSWISTDISLSPVKSSDDLTAVLMSIDVGGLELLNK